MHTEDISLRVSTNLLQPAPGDLLVITVDQYLSVEQRERFEAKLKPAFAELGCRMVVLEGGADVLLIKSATGLKPSPALVAQSLELVEKDASQQRDELHQVAG